LPTFNEAPPLEWPHNLSPAAGETLELELWAQETCVPSGTEANAELERTHFGRWRDDSTTPWSQAQIYSSDDALKAYFDLLSFKHDLLPIIGEPALLPSWTMWHWADIELTEYHVST
jgi:hypothetical protein